MMMTLLCLLSPRKIQEAVLPPNPVLDLQRQLVRSQVHVLDQDPVRLSHDHVRDHVQFRDLEAVQNQVHEKVTIKILIDKKISLIGIHQLMDFNFFY